MKKGAGKCMKDETWVTSDNRSGSEHHPWNEIYSLYLTATICSHVPLYISTYTPVIRYSLMESNERWTGLQTEWAKGKTVPWDPIHWLRRHHLPSTIILIFFRLLNVDDWLNRRVSVISVSTSLFFSEFDRAAFWPSKHLVLFCNHLFLLCQLLTTYPFFAHIFLHFERLKYAISTFVRTDETSVQVFLGQYFHKRWNLAK